MSDESHHTNSASASKGSLLLGALALALLFAIGVSILMTWHHESQLYGGATGELIGCESNAKTNCNVVNTSAYSTFLGVPIATWGIPTYVLAFFWTLMAWRGKRQYIKPLAAMGIATALYSIWLYAISKKELGFVCAWCMRLYVVNFAMAIIPGFLALQKNPWPQLQQLKSSALIWIAGAVLGIGAQQLYHQSLTAESAEITQAHLAKKREKAAEKIKDQYDDRNHFIDPNGDLPPYNVEVQTEDKKTATLSLSPTDPWKGSLDAKVIVVEFADFECPYCKRMASQLSELYQAYKGDALFVYKHFPLDKQCNPGSRSRKHRKACGAALASVCAQEQNRFWAFHDILYKNQHAIETEDLKLYAQKMGLDMTQFNTCLQDKSSRKQMQTDTEMGKNLDIHGTPRLFINGKLYRSGSSTQQLALAIEKALGSSDAAQNATAFVQQKTAYAAIPKDIPSQANLNYEDLSFSIDTFEAALENGMAKIGKHEIPATRMSWYAAKTACQKAGKRLCTEQEWVSACQNAKAVDDDKDREFADDMVEGSSYAYGEQHDPRRCWTAKNRKTFRPVYTGEMPGCVNQSQVYDLIGNVSEWVGATEEEAVLLGGAYDTPKDKARCYRRNDTYGPGYANKRTGFRCCSNTK